MASINYQEAQAIMREKGYITHGGYSAHDEAGLEIMRISGAFAAATGVQPEEEATGETVEDAVFVPSPGAASEDTADPSDEGEKHDPEKPKGRGGKGKGA